MLLETRRLILEHAGHAVVSVMDEPSLLSACQKHSFDVAVIGQSVSQNSKRRLVSVIREHCPEIKILELYPQFSSRVLPDADAALSVPVDVPKELADRVNELAKRKRDTSA
jgi:CheY-like chemotaxis protein